MLDFDTVENEQFKPKIIIQRPRSANTTQSKSFVTKLDKFGNLDDLDSKLRSKIIFTDQVPKLVYVNNKKDKYADRKIPLFNKKIRFKHHKKTDSKIVENL